MFSWFFRKKEVENIKKETKSGFDSVKKDMDSIGTWIEHLNSEKTLQQEDLNEIKSVLSSIQEELEGLKNIVSIMGDLHPRGLSKQLSRKQTAVYAVQTAVQTPNFDQFSVTERAIIWILLNTDMKLSYTDLAAILGKEKSTIRGQINMIRQKGGVIKEIIEKNGRKRLYIPEEIKEKLLKKVKVRVKKGQNTSKKPKKETKMAQKTG